MTRTTTALSATVKQFGRTPVLLALLIALPAYFVGLLGYVLPDAPITVQVPGMTVRTTLVNGTLPMLAALAAAMVAGIAGLFLTVDTLDADGWLSLAGLPARTLFVARALALAGAAVLAAAGASAVLGLHVVPDQPVVFVASVVVLAVTYGLLGAVVGVLTSRPAGVYVMLFGPAIDLFLFHSPLATDPPIWAAAFPGRYAGVAAMDAAFSADPNWSALAWGVAYLAVTAVSAGVVVARGLRT
ncbi:hypothetical protein [Salarchaeum japonicum]|uniref:hypothetical protein n=1 Tax=Salarchaeum japonicum TaxID=555573 RepID=UPI003C76AC05